MQTEIIQTKGKSSYVLKNTPRKGRKDKKPFNIPVIDVRDGDKARQAVNQMLSKGANGSKFIRESFSVLGHSYQTNHRKEN